MENIVAQSLEKLLVFFRFNIFSFTLYPAHSRVGIRNRRNYGNIVLRHFILPFSLLEALRVECDSAEYLKMENKENRNKIICLPLLGIKSTTPHVYWQTLCLYATSSKPLCDSV